MSQNHFNRFNWSGRNILIVEDDVSSRFYLKEVLSVTKGNLIFTTNGRAAIEECRNNHRIDLVLMDIQLPGLDGYQTTEEIKKIHPDLPVIAQTAYALTDDRQRCFEAGCEDYLSKPIEPLKLLNMVDQFLNKG